jgi:hypothetical protein
MLLTGIDISSYANSDMQLAWKEALVKQLCDISTYVHLQEPDDSQDLSSQHKARVNRWRSNSFPADQIEATGVPTRSAFDGVLKTNASPGGGQNFKRARNSEELVPEAQDCKGGSTHRLELSV